MKMETSPSLGKIILMSAAVTSIIFGLSACNKGFKAEVKNDSLREKIDFITDHLPTTSYQIPRFDLNLDFAGSKEIFRFVTENDPKAKELLENENFMGPPLFTGKFDLALANLDPNQNPSGTGSTLRFQAAISSSDQFQLHIESKNSQLFLVELENKDLFLTGFWDVTDGPVHVRLGIDSTIPRFMTTLSSPILMGTLSLIDENGARQLGTFEVPLCSVVDGSLARHFPDLHCP